VSRVDGAALREVRRRAGIGLRAVERRSMGRVTESHLSRVERGERPVTPSIVAVYEKALGVPIADAVRAAVRSADDAQRQADDAQRQAFNATMATVAVGGSTAEPADQLLADVGVGVPPVRVGHAEVAHVEQVAATVRTLDWQYGGGLAWQIADRFLRWALRLRGASMTGPVATRLEAALGTLAMRAGWAAFDADRHAAARALFTAALGAAVRGGDPDLRAHVLADVGAQYSYLGFPDDCLTMVWLAENEQVGPAVRSLLHGVKARAYATKGEPAACARELELTELAGAAVVRDEVPGWLGGFDPAHTQAVCGHAVAVLAAQSGREDDLVDASKRLTQAVEGLEAAGRIRALALCQTRLAVLHAGTGEASEAAAWARLALRTMGDLRSARVGKELLDLRTRAVACLPDQLPPELADQLGAAAA
jgi:transcriptional regulator with XRE-family HTH domain